LLRNFLPVMRAWRIDALAVDRLFSALGDRVLHDDPAGRPAGKES
jgi:hypothetical protein